MSYILDALKKLEHEKSRRNRGNGVVNISGALFEQQQSAPHSSGTGRRVALAVIAATLITFGVSWYLFRPGPAREKAAVRPPSTVPVPAPVATVTPVPPPAATTAPTPPASSVLPVAPALPVVPAPPVASRAAAKVSKPPAPGPAVPVAEDAAALLTLQELRKRTKKTGQPPAVPTIAAPPDIKLSGIAWQDDRSARRAVVNGFLMQEGGVVSGARITDIFQDRVRFSLPGGIFEIPLNSAGFPATGKY